MKIILSNSSRGAYDGIFAEIQNKLNAGEECVVITTDRLSATVEKALLERLTGSAVFKLQVSSFTRFATTALGENVKKCLTPEGSVMLITDVIERNKNELHFYNKVRSDGLANELYAAITSLRNSGIDTSKLNKDLGNNTLNEKIKDISTIYDGYLGALIGKHSDSTTRLEALVDYIKNQDVIAKNYFVIDMPEFNYMQLKVLDELDKKAMSLTVGLVGGFGNPNQRIYPSKTVKRLQSLSDTRVEIVPHFENVNSIGDVIGKYLFSYERPTATELKGITESVLQNKLHLKTSSNRRDEVLALALDIVKGVQKGGKRYRDFEVIVGDLAGYTPLIKSVFLRYNIPFFIDKKEMLYEQTKVRYLLGAIAVAKQKMRFDEVMAFVKNPLFIAGLDFDTDDEKQDAIFVFENYALAYSINYGMFFRQFEYGSGDKDIAEKVRQHLVDSIKPFDIVDGEIKDYVCASRQLLNKIDVAWHEHVKKLALLSEYYEKCAEQVDNKLKSVLDEIENVLYGKYTIDSFDMVLKSMFSTLKISLVPTFLDCVFVGDMSSRFLCSDNVHFIGTNSGLIPSDTNGGAVLTSDDEELFERAGIDLYSNQQDKMNNELFLIAEIMKKTRGVLTVSYSQSSPAGETRPSTIISQLKNTFWKKEKDDDGKDKIVSMLDEEKIDFSDAYKSSLIDKDTLAYRFATPKACMNEVLSKAIVSCCDADMPVYRTAYSFISADGKQKIAKLYDVPEKLECKPTLQSTSVSRLERFYSCPYSHYLSYILHLNPRDEGDVKTNVNGQVLHAVFEGFFKALSNGKVNDDNVKSVAENAFDNYINSNEQLQRLASSNERAFEKLKAEGVHTCNDLYEISKRSQFKPAYLEAKFGKGENQIMPMELNVDGKKIALTGIIDRVDVCDDRFIVIDYKTYKSASLEIEEIYYGKKLQLYIYEEAIANALKLKPSGVFYLPIFASFVKDNTYRYKYVGQVANDSTMRNQIDSMCDENIKVSVVPEANEVATDGTKQKVYMSADDFKARGKYAQMLATEGTKQILDGYIAPHPIGDICGNCFYANACRYGGKYQRIAGAVDRDVFYLDKKED